MIPTGGKMRASRTIASALALFATLGVLAGSVQAATAQQKKPEPKPAAKASMPKEIEAVIQEGLAARQGRQDMPFSLVKTLVLPAQANNLYPIFFFKAKNSDLGYAPSLTGSGAMETTFNVFFEFFQPDATGALKSRFGGKTQAALSTDGTGYAPEKEDWYSFGMTLPAGKYTMALVLGTPDMKKLSVAYSELALPGPDAYETTLWPTDPIIIMAMDQVDPDQRPTIHRGYFTWGAAKVVHNAAYEIGVGENLEILFFVLGAAAKDPAAPRPALDLEVNYEVQSLDGKPVIKWTPQSYELYLVNQPLPLFQTIQKLDEKGTVLSEEKKPLVAGSYNLAITVTDKVSGKKTDTKMAFSVK
jgi:hypothetical protein